jgi:Domain of unknown function (DUF222)
MDPHPGDEPDGEPDVPAPEGGPAAVDVTAPGDVPAPGDAPAPDDGTAGSEERRAALVGALRAVARRKGAEQAQELRVVAGLVREVAAAARRELASSPRVAGQPDDTQVILTAVTGEVMAVLDISDANAGWLIELAMRTTRALTATLCALEEGRIDLPRVRALADATSVCTDTVARQVEAIMLALAGACQMVCVREVRRSLE